MASQGEREPGVVEMCNSVLDSMVQDGDPEQDIPMQEQSLPQTNPKPEMGAAAAAAYDTPPPHLRQIPSPTPSETETDGGGSVLLPPLIAELVEKITQAMRGEMQLVGKEMNNEIKKKCARCDGLYGCAHTGIHKRFANPKG